MNHHTIAKTNQEEVTQVAPRFKWRPGFTLVLVLNAVYIVLFYLLMQSYT